MLSFLNDHSLDYLDDGRAVFSVGAKCHALNRATVTAIQKFFERADTSSLRFGLALSLW